MQHDDDDQHSAGQSKDSVAPLNAITHILSDDHHHDHRDYDSKTDDAHHNDHNNNHNDNNNNTITNNNKDEHITIRALGRSDSVSSSVPTPSMGFDGIETEEHDHDRAIRVLRARRGNQTSNWQNVVVDLRLVLLALFYALMSIFYWIIIGINANTPCDVPLKAVLVCWAVMFMVASINQWAGIYFTTFVRTRDKRIHQALSMVAWTMVAFHFIVTVLNTVFVFQSDTCADSSYHNRVSPFGSMFNVCLYSGALFDFVWLWVIMMSAGYACYRCGRPASAHTAAPDGRRSDTYSNVA